MDGADAPQLFIRQLRDAQVGQAVLHAGADRCRDGGGLFVDLLEHKVRITALFRRFHVPIGGQDLPLHRLGELVVEADALPRHDGKVALFENAVAAGILEQGRDIRRHEVFPFAPADDERALTLDGKDGIREIPEEHGQRVAAAHHAQSLVDGLQRLALVAAVDELDQHFGVGLALKGVALRDEPLLQDAVIFNDAVVHDAHTRRRMRMAVHIAGFAVGGPAGMADAAATLGQGLQFQLFAQLGQAALALDHADATVQCQRDTGGVIAAVLQLFQTIQQNVLRVAFANITNNATHTKYLQTDSPALNMRTEQLSASLPVYVLVWLA